MTPPAAATAAARSDQRAVRRSPSPSGPRRVSGPARGRSTAGQRQAAARTRLTAAPGLAPAPHGRARRAPQGGAPAFAGAAGVLSLPGRGLRTAVRTLPEAGGLPDRLLRSRAWIGVVAGLLIGLVFLQVSLLKINTGIGASVQASSVLEAQNNTLRSQIGALAEDGRITQEAEKLGMRMPAADGIRYLGAKGGVGGSAGAVTAASADEAAADDGSGDLAATDAGATATDDGSGDAAATDDGSTDTASSDGTSSYDDSTSSGDDTTASADTSTDSSASGDATVADSGGAVAPG